MTRRFERIYADGDHATIARITKEVVVSITSNACPVDCDQIAGIVARVIHELGKPDVFATLTHGGVGSGIPLSTHTSPVKED